MEKIREVKSKELKSGLKELNEDIQEEKKLSDQFLLISIAIIILIIASIIGLRIFLKEEPKTIDDLHSDNIEGELKEKQGYKYNGYSFVYANGLWYTQYQVQTDRETNLFNIPLHYGPKDLEDIPTEGALNATLFNSIRQIYITFDPLGQNLNYIALAVGEFDQNIIKAFNKIPVAACDKNETKACEDRPIITCNNTNMPVLHIQQKPETKVIFDNNCIIVRGIGPEAVRAIDRLLLKLYGIMP